MADAYQLEFPAGVGAARARAGDSPRSAALDGEIVKDIVIRLTSVTVERVAGKKGFWIGGRDGQRVFAKTKDTHNISQGQTVDVDKVTTGSQA